MKQLNNYCVDINKHIIKCRRYIGFGIKYFENTGHGTVIYENNQMNAVVYKQLEKLYKYMDELQSEEKNK